MRLLGRWTASVLLESEDVIVVVVTLDHGQETPDGEVWAREYTFRNRNYKVSPLADAFSRALSDKGYGSV